MWTIYFAIIAASILIPVILMEFIVKETRERTLLGKKETQILKGIAILLVILCHYMGDYGLGVTLFTPLGGIGVSLFLILAAYGLNESWKRNGSKCWWRKRIAAVFVPYAIVQLSLFWPTQSISATGILLDLFLIRPAHIYGWYMNYIAMWYVLFYVIMRFSVLRRHKILITIVLSVCMFFFFGELRAEQSFSFLCGLALSEYGNTKRENENLLERGVNWKFGAVLLFIGVLSLTAKQLPLIRQAPALVFNGVQLMIKLPCALGLIGIVTSVMKVLHLKFFYYVGAVSFELYLIHGYVLKKTPITLTGAILFIAVSAGLAVLLWVALKFANEAERKILRI